ncbi:ubiquitin recognition factor in ER-associated degradation protein 1-like [Salvia hispanica]|uniref:ubiquitin recognition factor in ER-associated degradation protein 1-like n=1 Tax=Salvia hispanica TaxID=49212 RepID=UPI002008FAA7|nr:ubiquitin recognition factor in ER-associated degradation protein 1-like [Salvia hispanica]XP_047979525.1 ubiquitin recognition factor in ER-associated degradation protein 1-like [Salvia hispanica]
MSGWESTSFEPSLLEEVLTCLPFDRYRNPELESGNKVVLPPSCLSRLKDMGVRFPWLFKIESFKSEKISHCGMLEFCADEGSVYVPRWMMENLGIREGEDVILRDAWAMTGTRMKLQPHEGALLEGDTIGVRCGEREREFLVDVLDVGPGGDVISLCDTDCAVEFATPLDYLNKEREKEKKEKEKEGGVFRAFSGVARRLDGGRYPHHAWEHYA